MRSLQGRRWPLRLHQTCQSGPGAPGRGNDADARHPAEGRRDLWPRGSSGSGSRRGGGLRRRLLRRALIDRLPEGMETIVFGFTKCNIYIFKDSKMSDGPFFVLS